MNVCLVKVEFRVSSIASRVSRAAQCSIASSTFRRGHLDLSGQGVRPRREEKGGGGESSKVDENVLIIININVAIIDKG